ncbi:MAG: CbiX/SirB N-terminal domain-containing protein [Gemmataceae bacterium]
MSDDTALLLIAHGSRHPEANNDLHHVADGQARGHAIVVASFLELAEPDIAAGGREVAAGARRVVLVPYFLSPGFTSAAT